MITLKREARNVQWGSVSGGARSAKKFCFVFFLQKTNLIFRPVLIKINVLEMFLKHQNCLAVVGFAAKPPKPPAAVGISTSSPPTLMRLGCKRLLGSPPK